MAFRSLDIVCTSVNHRNRVRFRTSEERILKAVRTIRALCYYRLGFGRQSFDVSSDLMSLTEAAMTFGAAYDELLGLHKSLLMDRGCCKPETFMASEYDWRILVVETALGSLKHLEDRCSAFRDGCSNQNGEQSLAA